MTEGRKLDLEIHGKRYSVEIKNLESGKATVMVNDKQVEVGILDQRVSEARVSAKKPVGETGIKKHKPSPSTSTAPAQKPSQAQSSSNSLQAVMPGVVLKVLAKEGQQVKTGEILLIIEAMKMENEIRATKDATIAKILVEAGQKVQTGDSMIDFV